MSEDDDSEKEFEPSPHKLEEARRKGDLVKSAEITVAATYGGFVLAAVGLGAASLQGFGAQAMVLLEQSDTLSEQLFGGGTAIEGRILAGVALATAPWFVVPMLAVLLALWAQRAVVVAPDKIVPKFSRINPVANAGQKFGRTGLFEFLKSFLKLGVISIILASFLLDRIDRILVTQRLEPQMAVGALLQMIVEFLLLIILLSGGFGAVDYLWQRSQFLRRNRMSRKELMDEMKQSEGDPHMKAQRRQKGIEIVTKQMIADVAKADVVIVNPTHYAVALQWARGSGRAPVCLAKGVDEVAARIRAVAMENGVPLHSDPPTARALHATLDVGQEIRPEHYKPVAAAIRFAEKMRRRMRERGGA